ncbi:hypothetical protein BDK92_6324 [Micromonospora pisi]|uniref:Excreted virulence factor EspC (Type VII ESX diderm) n=1 Tax=Micromonospora pisi TaxID=589240 RepID=A0A495JSD4_9ACTN|nr:hypothetical protein [Micromonospora pisi]RKR91896.1 hypothetical protein BDK92_6324 [Micromonospora pisi]
MTTPGGGYAQMNTGAVLPILRGLAESGRTLDSGWSNSRAAIADSEPGIGADLLGQAFRSVYAELSTATRQAGERLPAAILSDAATGERCVADYRAADARGASAFSDIPG